MLRASAVITPKLEGLHVDVVWSGESIDRPSTGGFLFSHKQVGLVMRLQRAINAQAVYANARVVCDVNGKSYVTADCRVGRRVSADLRRLGY